MQLHQIFTKDFAIQQLGLSTSLLFESNKYNVNYGLGLGCLMPL